MKKDAGWVAQWDFVMAGLSVERMDDEKAGQLVETTGAWKGGMLAVVSAAHLGVRKVVLKDESKAVLTVVRKVVQMAAAKVVMTGDCWVEETAEYLAEKKAALTAA